MDRACIIAALRVLPDELAIIVPVPAMLRLLGTESGGDDLLTVRDVAKLVKRKPGAIRNWLRKGDLPGTKVGRSWRTTSDDLNAFLKGHPTSHAPDTEIGSLTSAEGRMSPATWREKRRGGAG